MEKIVNNYTTFRKLTRFTLVTLAALVVSTPSGFAQDDEENPPVRAFPAGGIRGPLPGGGVLPGPPKNLPDFGLDKGSDDEEGDKAEQEQRREEARERAREARDRRRQERADSEKDTAESGSAKKPASGSAKKPDSQGNASVFGPDRPCADRADVKERLAARAVLEYVDTPIKDIIEEMARRTCRNFIIDDGLKGEITIVSYKEVSGAEAYQAFLSALEVMGYTTVKVGDFTKVIPVGSAASEPLRVYQGSKLEDVPYIDNFITQIFHLENVPVNDVATIAKQLSGAGANIISYPPSNTLIVTDSGVNIRRMWRIVGELDVASPKSALRYYTLEFAEAADMSKMIEEIYGVAGSDGESPAKRSTSSRDRPKNRRNRDRDKATDAKATSTSVGKESNYISKIVADERTNTLIVRANEAAFGEIESLLEELDVDIDPASRSQIHVVYLEHAKAEDVAQVLSNLTDDAGRNSKTSANRRRTNDRGSNARGSNRGPMARPDSDKGSIKEGSGGVTAAFEDGVKISSDENTNSLVIIASRESYAILKRVIDRLDIRRKQVFVEAVIMEMASDDSFNSGIAFHSGKPGEDGKTFSMGSAQLNSTSFGLDAQSLLSGLAMGVFGEAIDVAIPDGTGGTSILSVPAFGVALNALQANSMVNILSTPNILTLDNEEAKIVVGRNIPFPISSGMDANGNQLVSYQREDVAITLKVTPQINESNYVTLEIMQEVSEIEEDSSGLDVTSAGFITSKRSAETTVMVKDNQTIVIGGLMGQTETEVETKVPLLGDIPLIGALFRGRRTSSRKTNMMIVLTPHIIDDPADLEEVYRIKVAQRDEFLRRFYGRSEVEQAHELDGLLRYSMNLIDEPSIYRTKIAKPRVEASIGGGYESESAEAPEVVAPLVDEGPIESLDDAESTEAPSEDPAEEPSE
jgi:general secretion pathway protein D